MFSSSCLDAFSKFRFLYQIRYTDLEFKIYIHTNASYNPDNFHVICMHFLLKQTNETYSNPGNIQNTKNFVTPGIDYFIRIWQNVLEFRASTLFNFVLVLSLQLF